MKKWIIYTFILVVSAAQAQFTWDGGGDGASFGDTDNWNPSASYGITDDFLIDTAVSVTTGTNSFDIGQFDLENGAELTIAAGGSIKINDNIATSMSDGTLNVDGTFDTNGKRWDLGSGSNVFNVTGNFFSRGNHFATAGDTTVNHSSSNTIWKFSAAGSPGANRIFKYTINEGALNIYSELKLQSTAGGSAAIYLSGGDLKIGFNGPSIGDVYNYSGLNFTGGDDGIIFTDTNSTLIVQGNKTTTVNTWIADGALSTQVGALDVNYNGTNTIVTTFEALSGSYTWDGGGDAQSFGDADNWDPAGAAFLIDDDYAITSGVSVATGSNAFFIGQIDMDNGASLAVSEGGFLSIDKNAETVIKGGSTLTIDGEWNSGTLKWDIFGQGANVLNINGKFASKGNFFANTLTVNHTSDDAVLKIASAGGGNPAFPQQFVYNLNEGSLDIHHSVTLLSVTNAAAAIYLNGGDLTMGYSGGLGYNYGALTFHDGDDGIIFTDTASTLYVNGSNATLVATWIADGALSSTVGDMLVSYDTVEDETVVEIYTAPTEIGDVDFGILPGGDYVLCWGASNGASYAVESTPDLVNGSWTPVYSNVVGMGVTMCVTNSTDELQEFFRVILED
ncbi:hypothetical protein PDESU_01828 [Pontiella desulfatans]|uniref:Uncharacterized protein n=1 Tax=Pontiella desulfatans TaxID=2750659 RepID=A0A6C2U025_PONDE|nr:hypothetical protein [Pontiella desulfatans]VGO13272.1 hypothetical protein PDESU_01828 [Pontiella desulfatans]